MLRRLQTVDVGPVRALELELGPRLNLLTGDNGLGKSFVLDLLWWVLTGSWAGSTALPSGEAPRLRYEGGSEQGTADFDFGSQTWRRKKVRGRGPRGSVLYVGADRLATFVVGRNRFPAAYGEASEASDEPPAFVFTGRELWDGKHDPAGRPVCNGLIRDWVGWMRSRSAPGGEGTDPARPAPFTLLEKVLEVLSPGEHARLTAGPPRRVTIDDSREIPTLHTPWEARPVPVTLASAGVRRVLELAYALVWIWQEHLQAAALKRLEPSEELYILVDEPEMHLHPRWQRAILPALLGLAEALDPRLCLQLFVTTHSPIVLASVETLVRGDRDRLFHFDADGGEIAVSQLDWVKHGDAVGWLGSEAIDLEGGGRSLEAARAIRWADAFMLGRLAELPGPFRSREALDAELRRVLAADDEYWTYWVVARGDVAQ
ncbi:MAG: AAA family ATPase [Myxococcales bacterium]|nr:AAA family ATPase [Myxococcales bacterium]